jgi:hypothetical protein
MRNRNSSWFSAGQGHSPATANPDNRTSAAHAGSVRGSNSRTQLARGIRRSHQRVFRGHESAGTTISGNTRYWSETPRGFVASLRLNSAKSAASYPLRPKPLTDITRAGPIAALSANASRYLDRYQGSGSIVSAACLCLSPLSEQSIAVPRSGNNQKHPAPFHGRNPYPLQRTTSC